MESNVIKVDKVEGVEFNEVVGLYLTKSKEIPMEVARKEWEQSIREWMLKNGLTDKQVAKKPFLTIKMPCGCWSVYETFEDIPNESVPCSCGNPKHWFVKIKEETNGSN